MSRTEAQKRADYKSSRKIYEQHALKTRRDLCINRRIELAASKHNISKNTYIIRALESALEADGLTLEEYKAIQDNDENQGDTQSDTMID